MMNRRENVRMKIRKSTEADLPAILGLYKIAREFMKNNGNPSQWGDTYPETVTIKEDVRQGISHVCEEDGKIVGTFVFFCGGGSGLSCDRKGKLA